MNSSPFVKYASVILDVSVHKTLDYGILPELADKVQRGMKVEVPVRGRQTTGYLYQIKEKPDFIPVQPISRLLSEEALMTEELFELALWIAKYYCASLRDVLQVMLPSPVRKETKHKEQLYVMRAKTREELISHCEALRNKNSVQAAVLDVMLNVKKGVLLSELLEAANCSRSTVDALAKKGLLLVDIVRVDRSPLVNEEYIKTRAKTLNGEQKIALQRIQGSLTEQKFATHLLHGVTGSGKTEVYLQAISQALELGKGTIMLVPEISLTAQTIERFRSRFEGQIAILHHRLSDGERFDEWHRIRTGKATIVIGARSAIFSPVPNLGLIIVDEEHENSYKQSESAPAYHARDVAVMRAKLSNSTAILGSATPSLESYRNGQSGKYILSTLRERADAASLPTVTIVDMKREFEKHKGYTTFSDKLLTAIEKRHQAGEQAILFLNRRGYHTTLFCQGCSKALQCRHCDVSLTFHLGSNTLACHLCGFALAPPPTQCPACQSPQTMKFRGIGTEQVQRAIHAVFKEIRSLRLDADTTRHKGSHQKLLREFGSGKADLLIGTQMIAKGLHFPQVTLVGVLNADSSLNIPDFRASETVFQLITQVAGRAGRGNLPGEVIVQTCMPDNSTIQLATRQDYEAFYAEEIGVRELFHYPPFIHLAKLVFSGKNEKQVKAVAEKVRGHLVPQLPSNFELNPVMAAGHAKVKDRYRFQFLVKAPSIYTLNKAIEGLPPLVPSAVKLFVDIDPISTFF
jgi:primosomal protein N' (replication factor Y)